MNMIRRAIGSLMALIVSVGLIAYTPESKAEAPLLRATAFRVLDGNTLSLDSKAQLKLACIEAPPLVDTLGPKAQLALESQIPSGSTFFYKGNPDKAIAFSSPISHSVQEILLSKGLAQLKGEKKCQNAQFRGLEAQAKAKGFGIWARL